MVSIEPIESIGNNFSIWYDAIFLHPIKFKKNSVIFWWYFQNTWITLNHLNKNIWELSSCGEDSERAEIPWNAKLLKSLNTILCASWLWFSFNSHLHFISCLMRKIYKQAHSDQNWRRHRWDISHDQSIGYFLAIVTTVFIWSVPKLSAVNPHP